MSANDNTTQPSLVGGHAEYVKGVVEGTVGTLTGSKAWQDSAAKDKQAGIDDMKAASANRDPNQSGLCKVEEVAGKAVGCEGMEKEGAQSKTQ